MKVAIVEGNGKVKLGEAPMPEPNEYQCLCKILACATCTGTDQKIMNRKMFWVKEYPGILGHESVGRVVKTGAKVRNIRKGDMFLRPAAVYPGEKLGNYSSLIGGFAEYGLVTDTKALLEDKPNAEPNHYTIYQQKIPPDIAISPADATILITLKEISSFVANVGVKFNSSLVILGAGPVAMSICFFAKLYGAYPVVVIGRRDEPLARMEKLGADFTVNNQKEDMIVRVREITVGKGVNFIIDAAGNSALVSDASQSLASEGKIAVYATGSSSEDIVGHSKTLSEKDFIAAGPSEEMAHQYLLDIVKLKIVPLNAFYSHRLPFSKIEDGFELLKKKKAFKVVFEMENGGEKG